MSSPFVANVSFNKQAGIFPLLKRHRGLVLLILFAFLRNGSGLWLPNLQEPIFFNDMAKDNPLYGNERLLNKSNEEWGEVIKGSHFQKSLSGLGTSVAAPGDGISPDQKPLIAFMRAVLRDPEILIPDEASANIDTVIEHLLTNILNGLPEKTTGSLLLTGSIALKKRMKYFCKLRQHCSGGFNGARRGHADARAASKLIKK